MPSVVIYARVSTNDQRQDLGVQIHACTEYAERAGLTVRQVYQDHAPAHVLRLGPVIRPFGVRSTSWRRQTR